MLRDTKLMKLKYILQNKIIKAMYGYSSREPTRSLYLNHPQILPFDKLCVIQILLFIFEIKNNLIKHNFDLTHRYNTHTHSTRQAHNLNIYRYHQQI